MYPESIQKIIKIFSKFPSIGPRSAARFAFYLIGLPEPEAKEIANSILELKKEIKLCPSCFKPYQPKIEESELCEICSDNIRDKKIICVIEKEQDLEAIEKTKKYNGLYFILGGTVSDLKKEDIEKLRIEELKSRLQNPEKFGEKFLKAGEIILATNSTPEGESTALYLERALRPLFPTLKITHLGRGLPVGGELEYADEETLKSALEGRK